MKLENVAMVGLLLIVCVNISVARPYTPFRHPAESHFNVRGSAKRIGAFGRTYNYRTPSRTNTGAALGAYGSGGPVKFTGNVYSDASGPGGGSTSGNSDVVLANQYGVIRVVSNTEAHTTNTGGKVGTAGSAGVSATASGADSSVIDANTKVTSETLNGPGSRLRPAGRVANTPPPGYVRRYRPVTHRTTAVSDVTAQQGDSEVTVQQTSVLNAVVAHHDGSAERTTKTSGSTDVKIIGNGAGDSAFGLNANTNAQTY